MASKEKEETEKKKTDNQLRGRSHIFGMERLILVRGACPTNRNEIYVLSLFLFSPSSIPSVRLEEESSGSSLSYGSE